MSSSALPPPDAAVVSHFDSVFARYSTYPGVGLYHHCQRLHAFARLGMQRENLSFDGDAAYAIAMIHDLGLLSPVEEAPNYLLRSWCVFERETRDHQFSGSAEVFKECLVYNHRLLPVPALSPAAECFRQAVWIEHTRGARSYGLSRESLRSVFECFPRENLDAVLFDFARRTLRREPLSIVRGIFF